MGKIVRPFFVFLFVLLGFSIVKANSCSELGFSQNKQRSELLQGVRGQYLVGLLVETHDGNLILAIAEILGSHKDLAWTVNLDIKPIKSIVWGGEIDLGIGGNPMRINEVSGYLHEQSQTQIDRRDLRGVEFRNSSDRAKEHFLNSVFSSQFASSRTLPADPSQPETIRHFSPALQRWNGNYRHDIPSILFSLRSSVRDIMERPNARSAELNRLDVKKHLEFLEKTHQGLMILAEAQNFDPNLPSQAIGRIEKTLQKAILDRSWPREHLDEDLSALDEIIKYLRTRRLQSEYITIGRTP